MSQSSAWGNSRTTWATTVTRMCSRPSTGFLRQTQPWGESKSKSDTYMELQDNRWLTYHYRQPCQTPVIYSTNTEVEHFGPIQVKHGPGTVKWYKVLFRCLAVAAVHLEGAFSIAALYKSSLLHSQKRPGKRFATPTEDACCFLRPSVPTISDPWYVQLGCLCKKEMKIDPVCMTHILEAVNKKSTAARRVLIMVQPFQ